MITIQRLAVFAVILSSVCIGFYQYLVQSKKMLVLSGLTMGTSYSIKIAHANSTLSKTELAKNVEHILHTINLQLSTYIETSDISQFNQSATTDWFSISAEFYTVMKEALRISQISNNAFDVTIGNFINLWGFGADTATQYIPDEAKIDAILNAPNARAIELRASPYAIKKNYPELMLDVSAIAKGFAVDCIADHLNQLGVKNYIIEIGGEIQAKGKNADNQEWRVGIESPIAYQRKIQMVIALQDIGMATSGDYRNYFTKNNIRYSHIIHPATGKPVNHELTSVTVLHPSTMTADAMATALLVLGLEDGLALAHQENIAALLIARKGDDFIQTMTPQFKKFILQNP